MNPALVKTLGVMLQSKWGRQLLIKKAKHAWKTQQSMVGATKGMIAAVASGRLVNAAQAQVGITKSMLGLTGDTQTPNMDKFMDMVGNSAIFATLCNNLGTAVGASGLEQVAIVDMASRPDAKGAKGSSYDLTHK